MLPSWYSCEAGGITLSAIHKQAKAQTEPEGHKWPRVFSHTDVGKEVESVEWAALQPNRMAQDSGRQLPPQRLTDRVVGDALTSEH